MAGEAQNVTLSQGPPTAKDVKHVFLVPALDTHLQRKKVLSQVEEYLKTENITSPGQVSYLGQAGWEHINQVSSLTCHVMSSCRRHRLLPNERSILLSLHDQYQAIQLCLARINKTKRGEFMAAASDVLDVWNMMYKETMANTGKGEAVISEGCEELELPNSCRDSSDIVTQEMQEVVKEYREFLTNSRCLDHFTVYDCLRKNLKDNEALLNTMFSKVYIVEGLEELLLMERELLKLILDGSHVYKVSTELPFENSLLATTTPDLDISGVAENNASFLQAKDDADATDEPDVKAPDSALVVIERVSGGSLTREVDDTPRSQPAKTRTSSESETYVECLILSHLRLLINTRDELALTLACSMPGREISQQVFSDIRMEAQRKGMPMYQTILSCILKLRLGGKGYQEDPSNPVVVHSKPLGEFVDSLLKLQNIVEVQTDQRKGAIQMLNSVKSTLSKMKGCVLRRATIDAVGSRLTTALGHLMEAAEQYTDPDHHKPSSLQPCLKHLIQLCDEAAGHLYDNGVVDALGENLLTQFSSSKKARTPIKIPTVLTLFRSPAGTNNKDSLDGEEEEGLQSRILKKTQQKTKVPPPPKRYHSECSWAPADLSPINTSKLELSSVSPITGPSLKVVGKGAANRLTQNWKEIVSSMTEGENQEGENATASPVKASSTTTAEETSSNKKARKVSSKRSLLKDISNMADDPKSKKQKPAVGEKGAKKKCKPLLKGQRSITSFFKF